MSLLGEIVEAFRVELGRPRARAGRAGRAPRCDLCGLFVQRMCDEPYNPCGVCEACCPGFDTHQPPKKEPT